MGYFFPVGDFLCHNMIAAYFTFSIQFFFHFFFIFIFLFFDEDEQEVIITHPVFIFYNVSIALIAVNTRFPGDSELLFLLYYISNLYVERERIHFLHNDFLWHIFFSN